MKPTSPLSLFLFLRLASAVPIPLSVKSLYPTDCHSKSCIISLLTNPHSTHQPPPTHLTTPHFADYQLDSSETRISTTSSEDILTESLSSSQPLSSSYLLSLSNPASLSSIQKAPSPDPESTTNSENLPAKPSSALAELRAADLRQYWETLRPSGTQTNTSPKNINTQMHSCEMQMVGGGGGGSERFYYMRRTKMGTRRDYADLMVVGIVVLFLAVVVALEAFERCGSLGGILCGRRQRRGEIYLEDDDEDTLFIVKRPFKLSPAPMSRNKSFDQKENFAYDSDASESV